MFDEANTSRTLVGNALAGRCVQLAGEKAVLENQVAEYKQIVEGLQKEFETLKAQMVQQSMVEKGAKKPKASLDKGQQNDQR